MSTKAVVVVGAGTMGNGIAHVFAQKGHTVTLVDMNQAVLDAARSTIEKNLGRQLKKGQITEDDVQATLGRVETSVDLVESLPGKDLIVEAVSENLDVKSKIFQTLSAHAEEHAILASNTSSISITWMGAQTERAENVIGMHFFNPVPVMKLVEVVRGIATSQETFEAVFNLAKDLGKTPVEVQDFPGFVSNRILMPMINEAIYCVMENVASVEHIDTVMKLGMAHPMGPLTLADFIGLDTCLAIMEVLHSELGDDKYRPCPLLRRMVTAKRLGRKTGRGFYNYTS